MPELDLQSTNDTITVLVWACGILVLANIAQWAWMIMVQKAFAKERRELFERLGQLIEKNTDTSLDLLIWLKSGGE